jgi:hypothetical protein
MAAQNHFNAGHARLLEQITQHGLAADLVQGLKFQR